MNAKQILAATTLALSLLPTMAGTKLSGLPEVTSVLWSNKLYVITNATPSSSVSVSVSNLLESMKALSNWTAAPGASTLLDLTDVTAAGGTLGAGQILCVNGDGLTWSNYTPTTLFLWDVGGTPTNGQIMTWDGVSAWFPSNASSSAAVFTNGPLVNGSWTTNASFNDYGAGTTSAWVRFVFSWSDEDNQTEVFGWVHTNSATEAGVVIPGSGNVDKVWKTDAAGIPDWRPDATGGAGSLLVNGTEASGPNFTNDVSVLPAAGIGIAWQTSDATNVVGSFKYNPTYFNASGTNASETNTLTVIGSTGTEAFVMSNGPTINALTVETSLGIPRASSPPPNWCFGVYTNYIPWFPAISGVPMVTLGGTARYLVFVNTMVNSNDWVPAFTTNASGGGWTMKPAVLWSTLDSSATNTGTGLFVRNNAPMIIDAALSNTVSIYGTGAGAIDLYNTAGDHTFTLQTDGAMGTNTFMWAPVNVGVNGQVLTWVGDSNTAWATPAAGGGSETLNSLTVTQKFRLKETNILVVSTAPVILDLASWNIFKLHLYTNVAIAFTGAENGIANALVYFKQDGNGGHTNIAVEVTGGLLQVPGGELFTTNQLTTDPDALDLLEVKSGFYSTNLLAYWPKNLLPVCDALTNLMYGEISVSNTTYEVVGTNGLITIYLQRTNGSDGNVCVELQTLDGTATSPTHFIETNALVSWDHRNNDLIAVPILIVTNDGAESLYFTNYLTKITNATLGDLTNAIVTITVPDAGGDGEVGSNPGTTNLFAWFDFISYTNSHGDSNHLTEINTPAYQTDPFTYGQSTTTESNLWSQSTLDADWGDVAGDWSMVARVRLLTGVATADYFLTGNNANTSLRWYSPAAGSTSNYFASRLGALYLYATNETFALSNWYCIAVVHDSTVDSNCVYIAGEFYPGTAGTAGYAGGDFRIGGGASTAENVDWDHLSFWGRMLSSNECLYINHTNGTRTYNDLIP